LKPDELSALAIKVACDEKFASEIFYRETHARLLRRNKGCQVGTLKLKQINDFFATDLHSAARCRCRRMGTSNKELVSVPRLPFRPLQPH